MSLKRTECTRERKEHLAAGQDLEHGVAPVIEERYRAGFFHHRPESLYTICCRLRKNHDRTASCPVGPDAAWLKKPKVKEGAEERPAQRPGGTLLERVGGVHEDGQGEILGKEREVIQPLLSR